MGIKEYIRQTFESEPDNIKDIRLPKDQPEYLPFDTDREMTESDCQNARGHEDFISKTRLKIPFSLWDEMKQFLAEEREGGRMHIFMWLAVSLKILAAKKVEITDAGFKLTMPEKRDYQEEREPRPVRLSLRIPQ